MSDDVSRDLDDTLNIKTWQRGWEVEKILSGFGAHIAQAQQRQLRVREIVRKQILPSIKSKSRLEGSGVFKVHQQKMKNIFDGLLFPGRVSALSSTVASHDSLALGVNQIGMAAVCYGGPLGTFRQTFYRKELTLRNRDEVNEVIERLKGMHRREGRRDEMSELFRRGIRAYAERAILLEEVKTEWLMGMGSPCSRDIFYGLKYPLLLEKSLAMLHKLIKAHKKFVFVAPLLEEQAYLTIGDALNPGEYAILHTLQSDCEHLVTLWEYSPDVRDTVLDFVDTCCPDVIVGLFRVSAHAPPRLFYAHRELAHVAAHIAMADSITRSERGFPMLLDVAAASCQGLFGSDSFLGLVHDAYTRVGATFHHFGER